jgi:hypothetical protein
MNRQGVKDIMEVMGLAAIVVSLIFVAREVREVNLATKIAARESITQSHLEFMGSVIDQDVLPQAVWKVFDNAELTDFEKFQLDLHHQRRWRHYESVYYMYLYGVLTEKEWSGFRATIAESVNGDSPWALTSQVTWESQKTNLSEDFVSYVNALTTKSN